MSNVSKPGEGHNSGRDHSAPKASSQDAKREQPALRLDTFEGFLTTLEAMQGVHTVYVTPCAAPPDILLPPGSLAFFLTAKDEQNHVARCYLALRLTDLDLQAQRDETLLKIEEQARVLATRLAASGLKMERGQWLA